MASVLTQIDPQPCPKPDEDDGMNETQSQSLTEHEVAARLHLSVATLRAWRLKRKGPRYVRFGRAVRYLTGDLDRFIEESAVVPDAQHEASNGSNPRRS